MQIREFRMDDYDTVVALWLTCGVHLNKSDSRASIERILARDAELFLVIDNGQTIIGAVMGRYDGRRGTIHHLAVSTEHQRRGLGRQMLSELERRLLARGCEKVNLLIRSDNAGVENFYQQTGYQKDDVIFMGKWLQ